MSEKNKMLNINKKKQMGERQINGSFKTMRNKDTGKKTKN